MIGVLIEDAPQPVLHTYSGRSIDLINPKESSIDIEDIAHALSLQCRWGGRIKTFSSVAEHCVRVSKIVPTEDALWGLLHDAAESILVDCPRPVKYLPQMEGYFWLEERFMSVIIKKFGLQSEPPESVRTADNILLITEMRDLMDDNETWKTIYPDLRPLNAKIKPWSWQKAKREFIKRFYELKGNKNG
jgi:5'-deoxynucleotidase YfbR-like HD superfamily hydrolase